MPFDGDDFPIMPDLGMGTQFNPVTQARAVSGGYSAYVKMRQGMGQTPGPQAHFHSQERDDVTGDYRPIARNYTIRFGLSPAPLGPALYGTACQALIITTVAGTQIRRYMDVCLALAITVLAESVSVYLVDNTPADDFDPAGAQEYGVSVAITPGVRAGFGTLPTLRGITSMVDGEPAVVSGTISLGSGGGSAVYPIPAEAGVISVEVMAVDASNASSFANVTVAANGGGDTYKVWNPMINTGWIMLPAGVDEIVVNHPGSENGVNVTLTWGIEG